MLCSLCCVCREMFLRVEQRKREVNETRLRRPERARSGLQSILCSDETETESSSAQGWSAENEHRKKSEDRWIALNWTWEHRRSKYVNFHFYSTTGGSSYLASVVYAQAREKSNSYVIFIFFAYGWDMDAVESLCMCYDYYAIPQQSFSLFSLLAL